MIEECNALIQNKLPLKLKDLGSFSIPCVINKINFDTTFYELGASVNLMPLAIYKKLGLNELKLTTITLRHIDHSVRCSLGILENIPVKVKNFIMSTNFVVLEMDEDS